MFLSMSMSLSMSLNYNPVITVVTEPTPPLTVQSTQSPTSHPSLDVASLSSAPSTSSPSSSLVDKEALNTEAAFNTPLRSRDNASFGDDGLNMAAILSAVSGTVMVAVILTKLRRRPALGKKNESHSDCEEEHHTMTNTTV
jgi:hypothetical protein